MITVETIDKIITELENSYLIPVDKEVTFRLERYNKTIMNTIEDLIKLRLMRRELGKI